MNKGTVCTRRAGATDTACRCSVECRSIANAARRERQARKEQGVGGRVPAQECREHVEDVLAQRTGATVLDFARASGVSEKTLRNLMSGKCSDNLYISTADRIFAVDAGDLRGVVDRTLVPGERTRRIVEALYSRGMTAAQVAEAMGVSTSTIMPTNLDQVYRDTEKRAVHAFRMLGQRSEETGHKPVPGFPLRRRIEALMVLGWPGPEIARAAGVSLSVLSRTGVEGVKVQAETAERLMTVFANLRYREGPSKATANRARKLGYAPWAAWPKGEMGRQDGRPDVSFVTDSQWQSAIRSRWAG